MAERLHPADLALLAELVADRLAERLAPAAPSPRGSLVDVRTLAEVLGVGRDFVYEHARELGGVKLTASPKAPWRFDVDHARRAMAERVAAPVVEPEAVPRRRRARGQLERTARVELLPIRGQRA